MLLNHLIHPTSDTIYVTADLSGYRQRLISLPHTSFSPPIKRVCTATRQLMKPILQLNFCSIYKPKTNVMYNKIHIRFKQFHLSSILGFCDRRGEQRYTTHKKINTKDTRLHTKYLQPQNLPSILKRKITPVNSRTRLNTSEVRHALRQCISTSAFSLNIPQ
jgi:hypothetical protein